MVEFRQIICPVDFSGSSVRAFGYAAQTVIIEVSGSVSDSAARRSA